MQNVQELSTIRKARSSGADFSSQEDASEVTEAILRELTPKLESNSHLPLYRQISEQIEEWIEEGRLQAGDQLASERRMTELLQVSRRTIRAALSDLIDRKYISATHGRGNFVMEPPNRRELRFLALERFSPDHWGVAPHHYDLIHEAEEGGNWSVHYKYAPTLERLRDILDNPPSGYQGMLIFRPGQEWMDELASLTEETVNNAPVPLLIAGRDLSGTFLNFVSPNHLGQTLEATRKLIAQGHKRIGYISGPTDVDYLRITHEGYLQAMAEANLPIHPEDILSTPTMNSAAIEEMLLPFLAERKFTAVLVAGSAFSFPFEKAVQKSSIVVPDQLSAFLITEQYVFDRLTMRWTAHIYPDQSVIVRSLQALAQLSLGQIRAPVQELIPHRASEGATCRKI